MSNKDWNLKTLNYSQRLIMFILNYRIVYYDWKIALLKSFFQINAALKMLFYFDFFSNTLRLCISHQFDNNLVLVSFIEYPFWKFCLRYFWFIFDNLMISFDLFLCVQSPVFYLWFKPLHQNLVLDYRVVVLPQKWDDHAENVRISVDKNSSINNNLTLLISDILCEIAFVEFC